MITGKELNLATASLGRPIFFIGEILDLHIPINCTIILPFVLSHLVQIHAPHITQMCHKNNEVGHCMMKIFQVHLIHSRIVSIFLQVMMVDYHPPYF